MTQTNTADTQQWDKIISSKHKLLDLRLKQVYEYRDLIGLFVKRDFVTYYKQTILGPMWYVIQPLLSTVMYMLIFGTLAKIGTDGIPQILFYFSGTMLWSYFSESLIAASNVFITNKPIFSKVYFPRLTAPIASSVGLVVKVCIQFVLFACIFIYYKLTGTTLPLRWSMLLFPALVLWIGLLSTGIGMIISSVTTKYKDLTLILNFLVQLLMYATPVVYPLSQVPTSLSWLFYINPISAPIELFRICFFGAGFVPQGMLVTSLCVTGLCLFGGLILFNKNERSFVDVI